VVGGLYGIVEVVASRTNKRRAPAGVGAFAYADESGGGVSTIRRGYLYFRLPEVIPNYRLNPPVDAVKAEWRDLKSVAGTNQAIAFGRWWYMATPFDTLTPDTLPPAPGFIMPNTANRRLDLRALRVGTAPIAGVYETNGRCELSDVGNHAELVRQLREAVRK
jgi:hypothetical protein